MYTYSQGNRTLTHKALPLCRGPQHNAAEGRGVLRTGDFVGLGMMKMRHEVEGDKEVEVV